MFDLRSNRKGGEWMVMFASDTDKIWDVGYVSGAFDLFHVGHLNLLKRAKERCNRLIVGVLSDEAIAYAKKRQPIITLNDRLAIVEAIRYVDEADVTTKPLLDKIAAWEKYHFDAMFSGDDHAYDNWAKERDALDDRGAELVFFPYTKGISTSYLKEGLSL
jgi:glycerol-3-phosphate cytidylyltransferase